MILLLFLLYSIIAGIVYYFFHVYDVASDGFLAGLTGIFWPLMVPIILLTNFTNNKKLQRQEKMRFCQYLNVCSGDSYKYRIDILDYPRRAFFEMTGKELIEALEWAENNKQFKQDFKTLVK